MSDWNPQTWSRLLRRYAGPLTIYAAQWSSDPEDAVQEAFLELFQQPEPPLNVSAWLFTVTRNKSISASRSRRRRVRHETRLTETHPCWFEESFETGLDAREISRSLDDLPGEQREILVLRLWGELTFEEIAELTSSSSSTCHRRYQEALEQLRKKAGLPCPNSNP